MTQWLSSKKWPDKPEIAGSIPAGDFFAVRNEWYPWGLQISLYIRSPRLQEYDGGAKKRLNFKFFFVGGGGWGGWGGILEQTYVISNLKFSIFGGGGVAGWGRGVHSRANFGHLKSEVFHFRGGGHSGVNFGHLKSEVFHFRRGAFRSKLWSSQIWSFPFLGGGLSGFRPERGFLENLNKNLLFSQKPACASQIVSHICGD